MKIAQIAPLMESVPPRLYGGTERIVSYLTEELVRQGHQITLFATGDSVTTANLVRCAEAGLRWDPNVRDPLPYYLLMVDRVRQLASEFDFLHFHIDPYHFPLFGSISSRTLTTLHGRQDLSGLSSLYRYFSEMPLASVSSAQRVPIDKCNFTATVPHGIPEDKYKSINTPRGAYFAFLGRISPEKRLDRAIEIAGAVGVPLKIAAKVDEVNIQLYEQIKPLFRNGVEFVGEINDAQKGEFLGQALALLFPIDWPEPFGLVMVEAMACGTPVLAFRHGSVPEIVDDGLTGYIVDSVDEAIKIIPKLLALDRLAVRRRFEERFSAVRMTNDYINVYRQLLQSSQPDDSSSHKNWPPEIQSARIPR